MPNKNNKKALKKKLKNKAAKKEKVQSPVADYVTCNEDSDSGIQCIVDVKDLIQNSINASGGKEDDEHEAQLAALSTISSRLEENIINIWGLQKELAHLQKKQMHLLDGCVNFFAELQEFEAKNEKEAQLVLKIFTDIKPKIQDVFKNCLPKQIDALELDLENSLASK